MKNNLRFNLLPGGQEVKCGAWAGTCAWSWGRSVRVCPARCSSTSPSRMKLPEHENFEISTRGSIEKIGFFCFSDILYDKGFKTKTRRVVNLFVQCEMMSLHSNLFFEATEICISHAKNFTTFTNKLYFFLTYWRKKMVLLFSSPFATPGGRLAQYMRYMQVQPKGNRRGIQNKSSLYLIFWGGMDYEDSLFFVVNTLTSPPPPTHHPASISCHTHR